jgi:hypothetical protein
MTEFPSWHDVEWRYSWRIGDLGVMWPNGNRQRRLPDDTRKCTFAAATLNRRLAMLVKHCRRLMVLGLCAGAMDNASLDPSRRIF